MKIASRFYLLFVLPVLLSAETTFTDNVASNVSSGDNAFLLKVGGTSKAQLYRDTTGQYVHLMTMDSYPLAFGVNNSLSMWLASGGNVGVGTTSPGAKLEVYAPSAEAVRIRGDNSYLGFFNTAGTRQGYLQGSGSNMILAADAGVLAFNANGAERMRIDTAGNVGIGTTTPNKRFELSDNTGGFRLSYAAEPTVYNLSVNTVVTASVVRYSFDQVNANVSYPNTLVFDRGNVGVGTTSPSHKLAVNGTIRAKEVIVDTGWSDYVFADDYRLAPLSEVESHIKAERHLPGIPSAREVAEHGVSMGEMQAKLLAKIEELTLHLIAQEKELRLLREAGGALKK